MSTIAEATKSHESTAVARAISSKSARGRASPIVFSEDAIDALAQVFQDRAGDAKRTEISRYQSPL
jgi:hypothetical protein